MLLLLLAREVLSLLVKERDLSSQLEGNIISWESFCLYEIMYIKLQGFPDGSVGKESCNAAYKIITTSIDNQLPFLKFQTSYTIPSTKCALALNSLSENTLQSKDMIAVVVVVFTSIRSPLVQQFPNKSLVYSQTFFYLRRHQQQSAHGPSKIFLTGTHIYVPTSDFSQY